MSASGPEVFADDRRRRWMRRWDEIGQMRHAEWEAAYQERRDRDRRIADFRAGLAAQRAHFWYCELYGGEFKPFLMTAYRRGLAEFRAGGAS